jgi:hypothetical protein
VDRCLVSSSRRLATAAGTSREKRGRESCRLRHLGSATMWPGSVPVYLDATLSRGSQTLKTASFPF